MSTSRLEPKTFRFKDQCWYYPKQCTVVQLVERCMVFKQSKVLSSSLLGVNPPILLHTNPLSYLSLNISIIVYSEVLLKHIFHFKLLIYYVWDIGNERVMHKSTACVKIIIVKKRGYRRVILRCTHFCSDAFFKTQAPVHSSLWQLIWQQSWHRKKNSIYVNNIIYQSQWLRLYYKPNISWKISDTAVFKCPV